MNKPMMKCGHAANATCEGKPVCVICMGIKEGATEIDNAPTDLTNRKAKCPDCNRLDNSNTNLAFFEHRPEKEFDSFYCGCCGWD